MDELGHADPALTLRVHRHGMRRAIRPDAPAYEASSEPLIGHHVRIRFAP
jgi:hypothetical protein